MKFHCMSYSYVESDDTILAAISDESSILFYQITYQPTQLCSIKNLRPLLSVEPRQLPKILDAFVSAFQTAYTTHVDASDSPAALSAEQLSFSVDI